MRPSWVSAALSVIIVGGAFARFLGGSWGLPLELHPDEWVIVDGAIDMARRNSFQPPFFFRPDHVEMQLSHLAYGAYAYLMNATSVESLYSEKPASFLLISRTITACFGVAMIVVAYLIGTRFHRAIGVMAAFLIAFFPLYVDQSHLATPDVPLSLTLMIVILGCMRYLDLPSLGNLLLASFGVSVAIAIKYPGALGAIMIAITVITRAIQTRAWRQMAAHAATAIAAVLLFLYAISPLLITDFQVVASEIRAEAGDTALGADGLGWSGNLSFYATTFATTIGVTLLACFALGIFWSVRLRLTQSLPIWLGALYWMILSGVPLHWVRWGLPMYLTPLLISPIGAYYSFRYLREWGAARWLRWGALGLGAMMGANLIMGSLVATTRYRSPDTRTVATEYLARHGIDKTNTVFEGYTPLAPHASGSIFHAFRVVKGRLVPRWTNGDNSKDRYVVLSSFMYDRYNADRKYAAEQKFYTRVGRQFRLLRTFDPATRGNHLLEVTNIWNALGAVRQLSNGGLDGPTIRVYRIPATRPARSSNQRRDNPHPRLQALPRSANKGGSSRSALHDDDLLRNLHSTRPHAIM